MRTERADRRSHSSTTFLHVRDIGTVTITASDRT